MRSVIPIAAFAALASAAPLEKRFSDFSPNGKYFPLKNGFPDPSNDELLNIEKKAYGTLPNWAASDASEEGIINLQLIAFNELLEVAFFSELLHNVTEKAPGYDLGYGQEYVLDTLKTIVAQEQIHALTANGELISMDEEEIEPCRYQFPVNDFHSAIELASKFTSTVIGTLQEMNQFFAENGDADFVRKISSVIANEGEQNGFFRLVGKKHPSSQPFPTTGTREYAFSALQRLIVPGSCPNIDVIPLKIFEPLNLLTQNVKPKTQHLKFSVKKADAGTDDWNELSVVLINGQNKPITESLVNPKVEGEDLVFEAAFPYDEHLLNGLTVFAVTKIPGPFENVIAVEESTIFGPELVIVN